MTRIGPYTLHTIESGKFRLDGGAMFGVVPRVLWERKIRPDERNRIPLHMRCLLIVGNGRVILVDNGIGNKYDQKFKDIYAIEDETVNLENSLHKAGFDFSDITDVILTHLHFDHCGGSTRREGEKVEVVFDRARFHVQRAHWEWAKKPNPRERASFLAENIDPLERSGQLNLLDGTGELLPGIELLTVNGHTRAQQLVKISIYDRTLIYAADLLPTNAHIQLPWVMAYDVEPLVTMEEKSDFIEKAVASKWDLFFEHDPEIVVASLKKENGRVVLVDPRPLHEL